MLKNLFAAIVLLLIPFMGKGCLIIFCFILTGLCAAQNAWIERPPLSGENRCNSTSFSIGGKGYFCTGYGLQGNDCESDLWEYDPTNYMWTEKAFIPGKSRAHSSGMAVNNKGYIIGGFSDGRHQDSKQNIYKLHYLADVWEYDPGKNQWTQKDNFPGHERGGAVTFTIGDKGYYGTGYCSDLKGTGSFFNDFWEYTPAKDQWKRIADFPGGKVASSFAFSIGSYGYVCGSELSESGTSIAFWRYDPSSDTWSQQASLPVSVISYPAAFSIGNKGYVCEGQSYLGDSTFWSYDPDKNEWEALPDYPGGAKWGLTGFAIGESGFVGLGFGGNNLQNDFWEYRNPDCNSPEPENVIHENQIKAY